MIISVALAMALSMAPAKADPVDIARKAFNNCLIETHNKGVTEQMSLAAFNDNMKTACADQKAAYHDLIVKSERGYGSKPAEAEAYANDEVQLIVDSVTSAFADNVESKGQLIPEK